MSRISAAFACVVVAWLTIGVGQNVAHADARKVLSIMDTLDFRDIRSVHIAPSGQRVAYVVRRAVIERKKNEDTLFIVAASGGASRSLLTADEIGDVEWDRANGNLHALVHRKEQRILVRVDAESGRSEELWRTSGPIDALAISPDGTLALVSQFVRSDTSVVQHRRDTGFVYDYNLHTLMDLNQRDYADVESVQLTVINLRDKSARPFLKLPFQGYKHLTYVYEATISPDNRRAALLLVRRGEPDRGGHAFNHDLAVLDLRTGSIDEPVQDPVLTSETAPAWLGDSRRLFFVSGAKAKVYDTSTRTLANLDWARDLPESLLAPVAAYDPARESVHIPAPLGLYTLSLRAKKMDLASGNFMEGSFSSRFDVQAFVSQSSNEWPEVAIRNLKSGESRRLTDQNAYLADRALGNVEALSVRNSAGVESKGFLLHPVGYEAGRRYPLIVATYGFRGRFPIVAEWHTSFPAHTLAGKGYAVLMLNRPSPGGQNLSGDPVRARDQEGWHMLSTFENAVQLLVDRGIADPERLGLYGWSHGGFIVEFLLAHSKLRFKAAALGEGGDYKPGGYWAFGSASWPRIYENIYGGPMSAKTIQAYLDFSPGMRFEQFRSPLLLEFASNSGAYGLETFVHLRQQGKPAELVIYSDEEHNFVRPTVRFASMNRKVDWFDFWIKGEEDPDAAKAEQYARWRAMRASR